MSPSNVRAATAHAHHGYSHSHSATPPTDAPTNERRAQDVEPMRYTVEELSLSGEQILPTDQLTLGQLAEAVLAIAYFDEDEYPEREPTICVPCLQMAVGEKKCPHGTFPEDHRIAPMLSRPTLSDSPSPRQEREGTPHSQSSACYWENISPTDEFFSIHHDSLVDSSTSPQTNRSPRRTLPLSAASPAAATRSPQTARHPADTSDNICNHSRPVHSHPSPPRLPSNVRVHHVARSPQTGYTPEQPSTGRTLEPLPNPSRAQLPTSQQSGRSVVSPVSRQHRYPATLTTLRAETRGLATPPLPPAPPTTPWNTSCTYNVHIPADDPLHFGHWYVVTKGRRIGVFRTLSEAMATTVNVTSHSWSRERSYDAAVEKFRQAEVAGGVAIV